MFQNYFLQTIADTTLRDVDRQTEGTIYKWSEKVPIFKTVFIL